MHVKRLLPIVAVLGLMGCDSAGSNFGQLDQFRQFLTSAPATNASVSPRTAGAGTPNPDDVSVAPSEIVGILDVWPWQGTAMASGPLPMPGAMLRIEGLARPGVAIPVRVPIVVSADSWTAEFTGRLADAALEMMADTRGGALADADPVLFAILLKGTGHEARLKSLLALLQPAAGRDSTKMRIIPSGEEMCSPSRDGSRTIDYPTLCGRDIGNLYYGAVIFRLAGDDAAAAAQARRADAVWAATGSDLMSRRTEQEKFGIVSAIEGLATWRAFSGDLQGLQTALSQFEATSRSFPEPLSLRMFGTYVSHFSLLGFDRQFHDLKRVLQTFERYSSLGDYGLMYSFDRALASRERPELMMARLVAAKNLLASRPRNAVQTNVDNAGLECRAAQLLVESDPELARKALGQLAGYYAGMPREVHEMGTCIWQLAGRLGEEQVKAAQRLQMQRVMLAGRRHKEASNMAFLSGLRDPPISQMTQEWINHLEVERRIDRVRFGLPEGLRFLDGDKFERDLDWLLMMSKSRELNSAARGEILLDSFYLAAHRYFLVGED